MSASSARPARIALGPGREFELIEDLLGGASSGSSGDASSPDGPPDGPRPDEPPPDWLRVPPGDDAAVLDAGPMAISSDLAIEDVHFRRAWLEPAEIGWRAAAAALSDLAAVAACPLGVLASIGIPEDLGPEAARAVGAGVREAAAAVGARLLGGDVSRSPSGLLLDVTVLGRAERPTRRSGVRAGDELWVTGRLGGAAAAVHAWEAGRVPAAALREAFARPRPRIDEALHLADAAEVRAAIDLSDGLAGDAGHLSAASGVRIVLEAERIPLHPLLADGGAAAGGGGSGGGGSGGGGSGGARDALGLALSGGDDFELLLAVAPGALTDEIRDDFRERFGVPLTRIGRAEEGGGTVLETGDGGREPLRGGWDHLSGAAGSDPAGRAE